MERISGILRSPPQPRRQVAVCAVTGLSGIGKSSAAAGFVASEAFRYDLVFWVDASSDPALAASFRRLSAHLCGVEDDTEAVGTDDYLRERVHALLQRIPGRWLIVFDDAFQSAQAWLPRLGDGDVLITSIEAAGWHRVDGHVEVSPMTEDEAMRLVALRLGSEALNSEPRKAALRDLVDVLGSWPLAIELAAAYIVTCGLDLDRLEEYQRTLMTRALDDRRSLPQGYPRTLVAAVKLSVNRLVSEATRSGDGELLAPLAAVFMSCLAPTRIPLHLIMACVRAPGNEAPVVVSEERYPVHEVMRSLVNVSFVRYDRPLTTRVALKAGNNATVSMNAVLHGIIRDMFDESLRGSMVLARAAFHVVRWLRAGLDSDESDIARTVALHADALIGQIRRVGARTEAEIDLLGSMAKFEACQGRHAKAIDLIESALTASTAIDTRKTSALRMKLRLVEMMVLESPPNALERVLEILSADCRRSLELLGAEAGGEVVALATRAFLMIDLLLAEHPDHRILRRLRNEFSRLAGSLPATPETAAMNTMASALRHRALGRIEEMEATARGLVSTAFELGGSPSVQTSWLLLEALADQAKWEAVDAELDAFIDRGGTDTVDRAALDILVRTVGLCAAQQWIVLGLREAGSSLCRLLDELWVVDFCAAESAHDVARFALFEAVVAVITEDDERYATAMGCLRERQHTASEDEPWVMLFEAIPDRKRIWDTQTRHSGLLEYGDELLQRNPRAVAVVRSSPVWSEATAWAYVFLTPQSAITSSRLERLRLPGSEPDLHATVLFQPCEALLVVDTDGAPMPVEMQFHRVCGAGLIRTMPGSRVVAASTSTTVRRVGEHLQLVGEDGVVLANAEVEVDERWQETACANGAVLVFYGFDPGLDHETGEEAESSMSLTIQAFVDKTTEAGCLAIGMARWDDQC